MKKIFIGVLIIFILTACQEETQKSPETSDNTIVTPTPSPTATPYIDNNPIEVGLYQNGHLLTSIDSPMYEETDIGSFDVYFTHEENVGSSNTKRNFNTYYANYQDIDNYKIGFNIKFDTDEGIKQTNALDPSCLYALNPFIYIYLYDDIHQPDGAWYSHVEENEVNDETIYSSIKIMGVRSNQITSPIELTVFTYKSEDDFDSDGNYRGKSKYTITINKK